MLTPKEKNAKLSINETLFLLDGLKTMYQAPGATEQVKQTIKALSKKILYTASETRSADYMSVKAKAVWSQGIAGTDLKQEDLFKLGVWEQRYHKKKKYPFLNKLFLEHCNPLNCLASAIFDENKDIETVIKNELLTAWISKEENKNLNKKYRDSRPNGWKKCYEENHIQVEKNPSPNYKSLLKSPSVK